MGLDFGSYLCMCFTLQCLNQFPSQTSLGTNTATSPSTPTRSHYASRRLEGASPLHRLARARRLHRHMHAMPTLLSREERRGNSATPHHSWQVFSPWETSSFVAVTQTYAHQLPTSNELSNITKAHKRPDARDTRDTRDKGYTKKSRWLAHHKLSPKKLVLLH